MIDFILHIDHHLQAFALQHGAWVYVLLFAIVFVETGLIVMPFLPGDSLLFIAGALCGTGLLNLPVCLGLLCVAAILGDQVNFHIGGKVGQRVFGWQQSRWFNRQAFDKAHLFYEKHGGLTLVLARFMPLVRTFAPFVAGVAQMQPRAFTVYNAAGGILWVFSLCLGGYWFGNMAWVQANLSAIIWGLILVPGALAVWGALAKK